MFCQKIWSHFGRKSLGKIKQKFLFFENVCNTKVGTTDGAIEGTTDGTAVGMTVGVKEGVTEGVVVGVTEGVRVGWTIGI